MRRACIIATIATPEPVPLGVILFRKLRAWIFSHLITFCRLPTQRSTQKNSLCKFLDRSRAFVLFFHTPQSLVLSILLSLPLLTYHFLSGFCHDFLHPRYRALCLAFILQSGLLYKKKINQKKQKNTDSVPIVPPIPLAMHMLCARTKLVVSVNTFNHPLFFLHNRR